jgi:hypothetical protein
MTFWQFLTNVFGWFEARTTRILGLASGTLATLAATGVVPESQLKYYMAAIAVLTYWRGQSVSSTIAQAKAIVATATLVSVEPSTPPGAAASEPVTSKPKGTQT